MSDGKSFLPYHEPEIKAILVLCTFLLTLNFVNSIFDRLIFCGLVGQVFIGIAWGTPGAGWLNEAAQETMVQLGYLGLILLVYEGGLDTNFKSVKANLLLSIVVAITGIGAPMALSFILQQLVDATPLQAFAAGAALCSTSLGTTFTILNASGLSTTRLATVLTSAAMMDDVVGLMMVQVISNLGESSSSFNAITVVRPIIVSIGLVIALLACCYGAKLLTSWTDASRQRNPAGRLNAACQAIHTPFIIHTGILLGLVTGASYAGTSNLFAAYLAGAAISWWDTELSHWTEVKSVASKPTSNETPVTPSNPVDAQTLEVIATSTTPPLVVECQQDQTPLANKDENWMNSKQAACKRRGSAVYHDYFGITVHRILKPLFFASIGFAVPITEMFSGSIVWRGLVYTVLMLFAKMITGVWLVRLPLPKLPHIRSIRISIPKACSAWNQRSNRGPETKSGTNSTELQETRVLSTAENESDQFNNPTLVDRKSSSVPAPHISRESSNHNARPLSLYPAAMLGTAMTARGEIGFLIASLAETAGLFQSSTKPSSGSSEIYLIVVWAILLCTVIGPLSIGTLVKRVKRLEKERASNPSKADPLGGWGEELSEKPVQQK